MDLDIKEPLLTLDNLKDYFLRGSKAPGDLKIGVEWEKIGVYKDNGCAIAYSGERGVEQIFRLLVKKNGWQPVYSNSHIIALKKNEARITLEPGGQIELSGQKASRLRENFAELDCHLNEIRGVSDELGIAWLGIGAQPFSIASEIEWVPKERYAIMRESLKDKVSLTYSMMKETASIQISLDYTSERDAVEKLRLAMGLSPILSAMFANSPLVEGRPSGFFSRRAHIWLHTAPERTGIIEKVFNGNFNFENYIEYALHVPMLFIVRGERMIAVRGINFKEFMKNGFQGNLATETDWGIHLSTIFTEARLKQYLEIRCVDCQKTEFAFSAPALIKGIFYDPVSRQKAWKLVTGVPIGERKRLALETPKSGLAVKFKDKELWDTAAKLIQYAEEGLGRIDREEVRYLQPIKHLIVKKRTVPAEILLQCFSKSLTEKEKSERLISCAAI